MPDTFVGLVLFLAFLTPGLVFTLVRERRRPQRELSAFRETAQTVLVGLLCNSLTLLAFSAIRLLAPDLTPDVGDFVRSPSVHFQEHFAFNLWWAAGLLLFSCILGAVLGRTSRIKVPIIRWSKPHVKLRQMELGSIHFESAWYRLLHHSDDEVVVCACFLDDGGWVSGYVQSYSTEVEETADREIVLTRARYRAAGRSELLPLAGSTVVSARRMVLMQIALMDRDKVPISDRETLPAEARL